MRKDEVADQVVGQPDLHLDRLATDMCDDERVGALAQVVEMIMPFLIADGYLISLHDPDDGLIEGCLRIRI